MSKVYEYEFDKWRDLQSNFTKFLSILKREGTNNINANDSDLFLLKMLELNNLIDSLENKLDEIKYECIYSNSKNKDHKKIKREIEEHLQRKIIIKSLVKGTLF